MYLVTGGAGFIGSNLVEALLRQKKSVRVLDNFSTGKRENLAPFLQNIEMIEGDITDASTCETAVKGVKYILHQAARPSVTRSIADPLSTNKVNVEGTLSLLLAAKKANVKRFVYASSSSVYGDSEVLPKEEKMAPNPISPYGVSKLVTEYYAGVFSKVYGLETIGLRYFNVFGPRQDPKSDYAAVIPKFIHDMLENRSPTIFGDGTQSRDFCFIDNVVSANLLACHAKEAVGQSLNIACGRRIDLNILVQKLNTLLQTSIRPTYTSMRPGDIKHSLAEISLAKKLLHYNVLADFDTGLKQTVDWYRNS